MSGFYFFMTQNKFTTNNNPTLAAVSRDDGEKIVYLYADPDSHALMLSNGLEPMVDYDFIDVQQTSASIETYVYKLGGSTGTVIRTIVVTYTSNSKTDINTVEYS